MLSRIKRFAHRLFILGSLSGCLITGYWVRDRLDPLIHTTQDNPVLAWFLKGVMNP
jgi:hypothetical protein